MLSWSIRVSVATTVDEAEDVLIVVLAVVFHDLVKRRLPRLRFIRFAFLKRWEVALIVPSARPALTVVIFPELWPTVRRAVLLAVQSHNVGRHAPVVAEEAVDDLQGV